MKKIEYNGEILETIYDKEMTQDTYEEIKKRYYQKPDFKEVINEIAGLICKVSVKNSAITDYYFKDLMSKTKVYYNKWSIEDCFEYKPLLDYFFSKTLLNKKVYTSNDLLDNIETAFRLGGKGVASKVANYPIKSCDEILKKYNVNNKWYDMSCGWGARLTSAMKNNIDYYGTDPNTVLVDRLNQFYNDWKKVTHSHPNVTIKCHGSEIFEKEWVNTMGLCFTSPPYFYLEDYKIGNQSWKVGTTYTEWLNNYLESTIKNCYQYLIDKGYLIINIKDFDKYALEKDTKELAEKNGFIYIESITLNNISRINSNKNMNDNDENIMVFMKKGCEHLREKKEKKEQMTLF